MTKRYNGDSNDIAADKRFKTIDAVSNDPKVVTKSYIIPSPKFEPWATMAENLYM